MKNLILTLAAVLITLSLTAQTFKEVPGYTAYAETIDEAESGVKTFTSYGPAIIFRQKQDRPIPSDYKFVYDECQELLYHLGMDDSNLDEDNSSFNIDDFGADGEYTWAATASGHGVVHKIWRRDNNNGLFTYVILIMDREEISLQAFDGTK